MGVLLLFFIYGIQFWVYEYSMHTLNILSLNVNGLDSAVERARVGIFAPWIYFLCLNTREVFNMRDWIAPSSGRLSACNAAFKMFFFNIHDYIKQ